MYGKILIGLFTFCYTLIDEFCTFIGRFDANTNLNITFSFLIVCLSETKFIPMNLFTKTPLLVLSFLLFAACKKTNFNTTGKLVISFRNGFPTCYDIYTESSYASYRPLKRSADVKVETSTNSISFEGLNYGNYIFTSCSGPNLLVQVVAGGTRTYEYY